MAKRRKLSEDSDGNELPPLKDRIAELIDQKSSDVQLRPHKYLPEAKFQEIWLQTENTTHKETKGYLFCSHPACQRKLTIEKVKKISLL